MEHRATYDIPGGAWPGRTWEIGMGKMADLRLRPAGTSGPATSAAAAGNDELTIVTYNVGLVRVAFAGITVFEPAPFIPERLAALPAALCESGANVVALQEVFRAPHRKHIVEAVQDAFPYAAWAQAPRFGLSSGLLILADRPLKEPQQFRFSRHPFDERFYAQKGLLTATMDAGALGPIRLLDVHTTAGGKFMDYDAPATRALRSHQIGEVLRVATASGDAMTLMVGDFNTGIEAAEENYREIVDAGYTDLVKEANGETSEADLCTWDPAQPLANGKDDHKGAPRRLDHVFAAHEDRGRIRIEEARVVFKEPVVATPRGPKVPVSDHYGILIRLGPAEP